MPGRLRQGLLWPTVVGLIGVCALAGLGSWQLERKQSKEALIGKIAARAGAAPVSLASAEAVLAAGGDIDYLHVRASGRFHNDKERYLYAPTAAGLAWHVYTPLEVAPALVVWINRGFVPDASKSPASRPLGLISGTISVMGLARPYPKRGYFQPANDVAANLWYWPDVAAMNASAFTDVKSLPFSIDADERPKAPGGLPHGGVTRLTLPNRHLQYALTWYALALTLIAVYLALLAGRLRRAPAG